MKGTLLSFLFSFIFLSTASMFAQDVEEAVSDNAVNTEFQNSSSSFFSDDPQPIYNSPWEWLHQSPSGTALRWVKAWDANNWYAAGFGGTFLKTTDGGTNWFVNKTINGLDATQSNETVYDAHFWDMNTGIVVGGYGTCAKTTDGGETWTQLPGFPTAATCYDVYFVDDTLGFAVGTTSMRVYKTVDGGDNWVPIWGDLSSSTSYSVYASDENNIIVGSSSGNIRKTTNGGVNWSTINVGFSSTLYGLRFTDPLNGWVSGSSSRAAYTTDGGTTWTDVSTGLIASTTFYDIDIVMTVTDTTVYLTGDSFDINFTTDMGATWNTLGILAAGQPWTSTFYSTDFIASDHFITVGAFGLFNEVAPTLDVNTAHTLWIKTGTLYDIWVENAGARVIAVGAPGNTTSNDQAMYSTDGGSSWTVGTINPGTEFDFNALSMVTPLIGYAAGEDHIVYKTTDGGATWNAVTQPAVSTSDLEEVFFVDENNGYTFGASGNGYKTTDGGTSWTPLTTGITTLIYSSFFTDLNNGFIVGSSGNILKTTDGGATFTPQNADVSTSAIYSIWMVNSDLGYLSTASGKVRKTTNGGADWDSVDVGNTSPTLYDIEFKTENSGMVVGTSGRVFHTNDGGASWQFENNGMTTIYAVAIDKSSSDTAAAYVCGTSANIMRNTEVILPVELSSLTASVSGNSVNLKWQTVTEINNRSFQIERKEAGNLQWLNVGDVPGKGTTSEIQNYSFTDNNLSVGSYNYRIKQIDFDGSYQYHLLNEVVEIGAPDNYSLEQNYPNPFNPETKIKYSVPVDGLVTLSVYNILGEKVADIVNGMRQAGAYEVTFDASNLSSGMYIYQMKINDFESVKKMMIMK